MIAELDRYHGVVLRQLLLGHGGRMTIGVANMTGRVDAFSVDGAAFQIKHCAKRLGPWRFTYLPEHVAELAGLEQEYSPVWALLVCGHDGVVGVPLEELLAVVGEKPPRAAWVRVSRGRKSMYRVAGVAGSISRAIPRGVEAFVADIARQHGTSLT